MNVRIKVGLSLIAFFAFWPSAGLSEPPVRFGRTTDTGPGNRPSNDRTIVDDRFADDRFRGDRADAIATEGNDGGSAIASTGPRRREGSLLIPTSGRIVHLSGRWVFLPDAITETTASPQSDAAASPWAMVTPMTSRGSESMPGLGGSTDDPRSAAMRRLNYRRNTSTGHGGSSMASVPGRRNPQNGNASPSHRYWVLSENLMLQRVVESIRVDATDNRWTLGGRFSEFEGQNFIVVQSAVRAPVADLPSDIEPTPPRR